MKAVVLIKNGSAASAFEIREVVKPVPKANELLIKVQYFGLNFADVMARNGMYKEAPPLPAILGYDVTGIVETTGAAVTSFAPGDIVVAMTRFGGYAEYTVTNENAAIKIPPTVDKAAATALATQYCTAYFAAAEMINLYEGDKVLVQSGAGGVGTALIQYALHKKCEVFATAGSEAKLKYLSNLGVHHPINYKTTDFESEVKSLTKSAGVDAIFDAVGGSNVKKGIRSLAAGGRIVCYGASEMSDKHIFGKIGSALGFGFYHPVMFMMASKALIGVNMLRIADDKPKVIQRCLKAVIQLAEEGVFLPTVSNIYPVEEISKAHDHLGLRNSIGKVVMQW